MKFFSLISDEEIHPTPEEKVIPSKEFTKLKKASEILKTVKSEALAFREKVIKEGELIKEEAYRDGHREGLEKFNEAILKSDADIKVFKEEINKKIFPIAVKAAKKILGEELKTHPDRIVDIVIQALKPVLQHRKIKIYANKADIDILEKNRPKIKKILEQVESFSIEERMDVEPGGCIIETEAGIINAQLENQWRALLTAFQKFEK